MTIQRLKASASVEHINAVIEEDGCAILSGAASENITLRVRNELAAIEESADFGEGLFVGAKTKRLGAILKKTPPSVRLLGAPVILDLMGKVLGPYCDRFWLSVSEAITIFPGERAQFLHRDDELYAAHSHGYRGELMANVMWALGDFTSENGATRLVPGSHKWDRTREAREEEVVQGVMQPGDCLIYLGSLIHGGGENRSEAPRRGLIFGYALGWLRQYESQLLAYPPEVARFFPEPIQDLLGYAVHRPNLGLYEHDDPKLLLKHRRPARFKSRDFLPPEIEARARSLVA